MSATSSALEQEFGAILAPDSFHTATAEDAVAGQQPRYVLEPATEQQLAALLKIANDAKLAVIPRGGGSKLFLGNAPKRADVVLSTARLNRIIEHIWADLTVSVEAGCAVDTLQTVLARHGQRLAVDALWPERATIGGILSTGDSGALRLRFGALRDLILGVTIALPDGALASSGGKVVKNVAGYDLPKLVTGALGTLGVITRAVFRLHPLPRLSRTFTCLAHDRLAEAQRLLLAIQDSQLAHNALQIRLIKESPEPRIDILFEGTEAGIAAQVETFKSTVAPAAVVEADRPVWNARQDLYTAAQRNPDNCALAKFSILPASFAPVAERLRSVAGPPVHWDAVVQATGIGHVLVRGETAAIFSVLERFRKDLERAGGSLVVHQHPSAMPTMNAWGEPGDTLPLMRALKTQFDPKNTLNPGRFVGGI